jgi:hypothetical protein
MIGSSIIQVNQGHGWAEYGMVQFFNRQVYIDGYLENEGFIAYAPEDVERHHRWNTFGYNIGRVDNHAYHLNTKELKTLGSQSTYAKQ